MFEWIRKRKKEKINRWKQDAKNNGAKFLVIVFDIWDKTERCIYDKTSLNCRESSVRAASYNSNKYVIDVIRIEDPVIKHNSIKCEKCGYLMEFNTNES